MDIRNAELRATPDAQFHMLRLLDFEEKVHKAGGFNFQILAVLNIFKLVRPIDEDEEMAVVCGIKS